jgi:CheY-like chemotaxis protein
MQIAALPNTLHRRELRILVVDDVPAVANALQTLLEDLNCSPNSDLIWLWSTCTLVVIPATRS